MCVLTVCGSHGEYSRRLTIAHPPPNVHQSDQQNNCHLQKMERGHNIKKCLELRTEKTPLGSKYLWRNKKTK